MATLTEPDRFTTLPDDETIAEAASGLEARGMSAEVVDDLDAARRVVLARIPERSSVMTFPSVTLEETGIAAAIDDGGPYASARNTMMALDRATQMREIKELMVGPDFALGSVQALTRGGVLVIASALGSQLAAHAWGATHVILVAGAQKIVPDLDAARERVYEHTLKLEDARAREAYGVGSRVGKVLEIHQEDPGRIHVVVVRRPVGF